MDLSDIRVALRRYWFLAALALAVWVLLGAAMALLPAPRYRASATLLVTPTSDLGTSSVQIANFQIPGIIAVVQSRSFSQSVEASLPRSVRTANVDISASSQEGTGIIRVSVEGTDAAADAAWATALVNQILDENVTRSDLVDARVLDTASVPSTPVSPQKVPIFIGTTVLGLISAVLVSVVAQRLRRALDVVTELERRLGIPVIGRIPALRSLQRAQERGQPELLTTAPELVEAFQSLRTNLELALLGAPPQAQRVSVCSWGEGEGKSTVAAGLALTIAATGHQVLAVDTDLRRPELHSRLGIPFGPGVAQADHRPIQDLVVQTGRQHLQLLRAGLPTRHPADVLAATLEPITAYAQSRSLRVVFDPPPYHGVAETGLVLSAAHYVVLVIDVRRSKVLELEEMVTRLKAAGVNIIGVVLNRVPKSHTDSAYAPYEPRIESRAGERPTSSAPRAVQRPTSTGH